MRILLVSSFGYIRGGLERVMFDELQWLRDAGDEVEYFATANERNEPAEFARLFPEAHDYSAGGKFSVPAVVDMFWNVRAAGAFSAVLSLFGPDVVHCHGIGRHLSPSILPEAKRRGVPVVTTAHDYAAVCPCVTLIRGGKVVCSPRVCGRRVFWGAIVYRCIQGSLPRSLLASVEASYQGLLVQLGRYVRTTICPSRFMAEALSDYGRRNSDLVVLPNAVPEISMADGRRQHGPFLVAGRLTPAKGAETALAAARLAGVPIVVAGTGPLLESLAARYPDASFVGLLDEESLNRLMSRATAVVVPSQWFENASMSVLEAMAAGVPVIASRIGGIPEQITDGREGLLVPPGDAEALAAAMRRLWTEPELATEMGEHAQQTARERFSPAAHVAGLTRIYQNAIASA